jgi:hypothetical protein
MKLTGHAAYFSKLRNAYEVTKYQDKGSQGRDSHRWKNRPILRQA